MNQADDGTGRDEIEVDGSGEIRPQTNVCPQHWTTKTLSLQPRSPSQRSPHSKRRIHTRTELLTLSSSKTRKSKLQTKKPYQNNYIRVTTTSATLDFQTPRLSNTGNQYPQGLPIYDHANRKFNGVELELPGPNSTSQDKMHCILPEGFGAGLVEYQVSVQGLGGGGGGCGVVGRYGLGGQEVEGRHHGDIVGICDGNYHL